MCSEINVQNSSCDAPPAPPHLNWIDVENSGIVLDKQAYTETSCTRCFAEKKMDALLSEVCKLTRGQMKESGSRLLANIFWQLGLAERRKKNSASGSS